MNDMNDKADRVVSFRLSAPLETVDKNIYSRRLEEKIAEFGKIRLLIVLEKYSLSDVAMSLYEDLSFVKLHADHIERMAVVGHGPAQETWIGLFGLFGGMETSYFDRSEEKKAAEWIAE